ncbi:hypothetical protein AB0408_38845, partial [Streptomyces sp. NPDC093707]
GVFEALLEGMITEAAKRGEVDLSLVSVDSTTARAHHDAAGMQLDQELLTAMDEPPRFEWRLDFMKGSSHGTTFPLPA